MAPEQQYLATDLLTRGRKFESRGVITTAVLISLCVSFLLILLVRLCLKWSYSSNRAIGQDPLSPNGSEVTKPCDSELRPNLFQP
ncbi:hypothetical protein AMTR_s00021p00162900 [Amborella trichopoda]|uniref:Uncharacterized protein n=1 Tax=Amborella trichopoda TaxID=13333 RepID=W1PVB9_AMBTC|nr:hypothetical protein AMTR_s00021p00162900 [Amborella trichopoda]